MRALGGILRTAAIFAAATIALCCSASAAMATEPGGGQEVKNGFAVSAPCSKANKEMEDEDRSWSVSTLDPRRIKSSGGGTELAAPEVSRPVEFKIEPSVFYIPIEEGEGAPKLGGGCGVLGESDGAIANGSELELFTPGPYELEEIKATVHWEIKSDSDTTPPTPCGGNDKYITQPDATLEHPEEEPPIDSSWKQVGFCNTVKIVHFNVLGGEGGCKSGGTFNYSEWPAVGYFNQYLAGKYLHLPLASEGEPGGNACGPSSLLMAMRLNTAKAGFAAGQTPEKVEAEIAALPSLPKVYDGSMTLSRAKQEPEEENGFNGDNALRYLHNIGWKGAKWVELGTGKEAIDYENQSKIQQALDEGPILISTAFGNGRWGSTGGGHVIMLYGNDAAHPSEVDVYDPAGNFFAKREHHYNSKSCGYNVPYPWSWLLAYSTGRAFLKLGTPPLKDPPVISVSDAQPDTASAPENFYFEDTQGRKTGWIGSHSVNEIPEGEATQVGEILSEPDAGFEELGDEELVFKGVAEPKPAARTARIASPSPGIVLHVGAAGAGAYSLDADFWSGGEPLAEEVLSGPLSGGQVVSVTSAALGDAIAATPSGGGETGGGESGGNTNGGGNTNSTGNTSGGNTSGGSASSGGSTAGSTAGSSSSPTSTPSQGAHGKPLTTAQKLAAALKVCKKAKSKSKRRKCEAQAKLKYRSKAPAKQKKKK